jgi:hypothetical protein
MVTISKASNNKWFSWNNWPKKIDETLESSMSYMLGNFKNHGYCIKFGYLINIENQWISGYIPNW